jgi:ankyrin repeat protein
MVIKAAVESLLVNNVEVNARDRWGNTPSHQAVHQGKKDVAQLLRQRGGYE